MTAAIGVAWTTVRAWRGHRISVDAAPDQISLALLLIGGLLLGIVESLSVVFVQAAYIDVVAFGILVAVLLFRPTGILGERLGRAA